jgi:TRAP-type uncharacterized transport system substrate-binding protein
MLDPRIFAYRFRKLRLLRSAPIWLSSFLHFVLAPQVLAQQAGPLGRYETELMRDINSATIGLAAGLPEGAPLRFATELARIVDDGTKMRVLPIVTRGPFENVNDLLYLRGVDAAIVNGDVLEHFKNDPKIGSIDKRIHYLTHLFPSEVHVFVRPEIKSLEDLAGKPVNFNTHGTAAAYSGPIIFERLGIKLAAQFVPHPVALAEMAKSDKFAAVVFVSAKPLDPLVRRKWPEGFRFLPVPLTEELEEYYLPAQLEASDYPGLIAEGQSIETIAVPAVLAVYAWPRGSDRHDRIVRFIDYLFDRLPRLQQEPGYHPKWGELSLAGTVPGWRRFAAMQAKLDAMANTGGEAAKVAPRSGKAARKSVRARRDEAAKVAPRPGKGARKSMRARRDKAAKVARRSGKGGRKYVRARSDD